MLIPFCFFIKQTEIHIFTLRIIKVHTLTHWLRWVEFLFIEEGKANKKEVEITKTGCFYLKNTYTHKEREKKRKKSEL